MLKIFLQVHWFRHSTTVLTSFLTVGISESINLPFLFVQKMVQDLVQDFV